MNRIEEAIAESIALKEALLKDSSITESIRLIAQEMAASLGAGRKVLFCGNGGSAADAQHLAAELSGKFYFDREPLFAEALHVNTSYLTAVANDYSYEETFARLVKAKGRSGDMLICISTSGNSKNVIAALEAAGKAGMVTVGLTGEGGGRMKGLCKYLLAVPSSDTPRIQEAHILIGHIMCELVEAALFGK